MKTTINEKGVLIIKPENQLEAYALVKWSDNFIFPEDKGEGNSLLLIEAFTPVMKKGKLPKRGKTNGNK